MAAAESHGGRKAGARAGTTRSPIWRSGGVVRGNPSHSAVNRKMYRGALQCIVSELIRQSDLLRLSLSVEAPKTKTLLGKLKELDISGALIVTEEVDENYWRLATSVLMYATLKALILSV